MQFRKYYDAVLSFERATEFDKNFYEAYLALAGCHRTLRDEPKMKLNLLYAFSIKPSIPEAVYEYTKITVRIRIVEPWSRLKQTVTCNRPTATVTIYINAGRGICLIVIIRNIIVADTDIIVFPGSSTG